MTTEGQPYQRLPGRSRKWFTLVSRDFCSLWLANDHLLHAHFNGYTQHYKRFYLTDIQAISLSRNTKGRWLNIIAGLLIGVIAVPLLGFLLGNGADLELDAVFAALEVPFLLILIYNVLLGPTCACKLYSAVQAEDLPSLGRLRTAQRAIDMLSLAIEAAQGRPDAASLEAEAPLLSDIKPAAHAIDPNTTGNHAEN